MLTKEFARVSNPFEILTSLWACYFSFLPHSWHLKDYFKPVTLYHLQLNFIFLMSTCQMWSMIWMMALFCTFVGIFISCIDFKSLWFFVFFFLQGIYINEELLTNKRISKISKICAHCYGPQKTRSHVEADHLAKYPDYSFVPEADSTLLETYPAQ